MASTGPELQALVTDQNLAGNMTGSALADYARWRHPSLNIVVMSGNAVDRLPPRTIFLNKSFAPRELLEAVRN